MRYRTTFKTTIEVFVDLNADDEDEAADRAWLAANDYLATLPSVNYSSARVVVDASLDGIDADTVTAMERTH